MLWDVHNKKEIKRIPHKKEYAIWQSRLTPSQIEGIKTEIRRLIREKGDEIAVAGWIPGNDWAGTIFEPICTVACLCNEEASAKCFGLMVWEALMEHEEYWGFGRYELNHLPIESMTYFKVHPRQ